MNAWWQQLAARDRRILILGAIGVAAILYVFALRIPAYESVADLETQVRRQQDLVAWMEQARSEIRTLRGETPEASESAETQQALYSLVDASARAAEVGSSLERVEPTGDGGARMRFTNVAFDELIDWLVQLRRDHGAITSQLTVRRADDPGRVNAQLVLEQG